MIKKIEKYYIILFIVITSFIIVGDISHSSILINNGTALKIPTYDGSGQVSEPDLYYNSSGWNLYKYWMVMAPYPFSNDLYENPSILVSEDGTVWKVPDGLNNPIADKPTDGSNSDPAIAFNPKDNTLNIFYTESTYKGFEIEKKMKTADGIHWTSPIQVLSKPNYQLICPVFLYSKDGQMLYTWYVDSGNAGSEATSTQIKYRFSNDDGYSWSDEQTVNIHLPNNRLPWHLNIIYIPNKEEYVMIITAGIHHAFNLNVLYLAYSKDRINWSVIQNKLLDLGPKNSWDSANIYRSDIKYIDNKIKLWYSAEGSNRAWYLGYSEGLIGVSMLNKSEINEIFGHTATASTNTTITSTNTPTKILLAIFLILLIYVFLRKKLRR